MVKHAKSGLKQRRGRAGRTGEGEYYALYAQDDPDREEFQKPEILRSNLAKVVLMLKKIGVEDVRKFDFIDPSPVEEIDRAYAKLIKLGALDDEERLTELGKLMAEFPVEPHVAKLLSRLCCKVHKSKTHALLLSFCNIPRAR